MTSPATNNPHKTYGPASLWAGVLGAPALWSCQLQIGYMLVQVVCPNHMTWVLHAVTLAFFAGSLATAWFCYRDWSAMGGGSGESDAGDPAQRTRFLAMLGLLSAVLFSFVILVQGSVSFFFDPCWK